MGVLYCPFPIKFNHRNSAFLNLLFLKLCARCARWVNCRGGLYRVLRVSLVQCRLTSPAGMAICPCRERCKQRLHRGALGTSGPAEHGRGSGAVLHTQLLGRIALSPAGPGRSSPPLFQHSSGVRTLCRPEPCRAVPGLTLNTERALIRLSYNSSPNTRESSLSTLCPGTKSR